MAEYWWFTRYIWSWKYSTSFHLQGDTGSTGNNDLHGVLSVVVAVQAQQVVPYPSQAGGVGSYVYLIQILLHHLTERRVLFLIQDISQEAVAHSKWWYSCRQRRKWHKWFCGTANTGGGSMDINNLMVV